MFKKIYGETDYTFALYNQPYLQDILELITELYLVLKKNYVIRLVLKNINIGNTSAKKC